VLLVFKKGMFELTGGRRCPVGPAATTPKSGKRLNFRSEKKRFLL